MKKRTLGMLRSGIALLAAFAVWTAAVCCVDPAPIGPQGSTVGFAVLNGFIHRLTGVNMALYALTDWLSLVPLGFIGGFGLLGLCQWIRRKSLRKVDRSILILGGFYIAVMAVFVFFELYVVNYRPVLIDGNLEASYPSSTTMLVLCVMPTAVMQLNQRIRNRICRRCVGWILTGFAVFMVMGRLLSGVHWFTDIIGGGLFSAGAVLVYRAACDFGEK